MMTTREMAEVRSLDEDYVTIAKWGVEMIEAIISIKDRMDWSEVVLLKYDAKIKVIDTIHRRDKGCRILVELTVEDGQEEALIQDIKKCPAVLDADLMVSGRGIVHGMMTTTEGFGECSRVGADVFLLGVEMESDGRVLHRFVAQETCAIRDLVSRIEGQGNRVELLKVRSLQDNEMLTPKQEDVLMTAMELGYFDHPRRIKLKDLATKFKVSMSTLSEIIRGAQRKVIEDYLAQDH
jgi:predicted DNA binding protein